jgi:hypothetical protein
MKEPTIYDNLLKSAKYALNSYDRELVYECLGQMRMAAYLNAITHDEATTLDTMLIRNGLNNPEWFHQLEQWEKVDRLVKQA